MFVNEQDNTQNIFDVLRDFWFKMLIFLMIYTSDSKVRILYY